MYSLRLALSDDNRQAAEFFYDRRTTATRTCHETLHFNRAAHCGFRNIQTVNVHVVVVFSVGHSRLQNFFHIDRDTTDGLTRQEIQ